jgi:hypothetical protein
MAAFQVGLGIRRLAWRSTNSKVVIIVIILNSYTRLSHQKETAIPKR